MSTHTTFEELMHTLDRWFADFASIRETLTPQQTQRLASQLVHYANQIAGSMDEPMEEEAP